MQAEAIAALAAVFSAIAAGSAAAIGYMGYRNARHQARHDLFERRFAIYKAVQIFLSQIMAHADLVHDTLPEFYDAMQKAKFLFGRDVNEYLEKIKERAFALSSANISLRETGLQSEERKKAARASSVELGWLTDQLTDLHEHFGPYMKLVRK